MKVAYLGSRITMPGAPHRRSDAFEHDQMMTALGAAFKANEASVEDIAWDDQTDWRRFDAVIIGTTWDYCDRLDEFLDRLDAISAVAPVFNAPALVRWNSHKRYLRDLETRGVRLIPTLWIDDPEMLRWDEVFATFRADAVVVKRQVGANGEGQFRLSRGDAPPPLTSHPLMVQPFFETVVQEGEFSFVFIDGALSHAVIKKPAADDYRIQTTYGGSEAIADPSAGDIQAASSVLQMVDETPLYARVDMLRNAAGDLCLMELELVEPFLYPLQGPEFAQRLYRAIERHTRR